LEPVLVVVPGAPEPRVRGIIDHTATVEGREGERTQRLVPLIVERRAVAQRSDHARGDVHALEPRRVHRDAHVAVIGPRECQDDDLARDWVEGGTIELPLAALKPSRVSGDVAIRRTAVGRWPSARSMPAIRPRER